MYIHVYFCFLLNHQEAFSAAVAKAARARELWPEALETSVELWHCGGGLCCWLGWGLGWVGRCCRLAWRLGRVGRRLGRVRWRRVPWWLCRVGWWLCLVRWCLPRLQFASALSGPPPGLPALAFALPTRRAHASCPARNVKTIFFVHCAQAGFIAAVELVRLPQPQAYLEGCGTWQLYPNYKYSCKATYKESPSDTPLPLRFRF